MTTEHQDVHVLSPHGEPRGLQMTEETFEPAGLVLTVSGELDIATAPSLREQLSAAIDAGTPSSGCPSTGSWRWPSIRPHT